MWQIAMLLLYFFNSIDNFFYRRFQVQHLPCVCVSSHTFSAAKAAPHFVYISPADDVAFRIELSPEGIRSCEENTLIKKGYSLLKEIKTLLP